MKIRLKFIIFMHGCEGDAWCRREDSTQQHILCTGIYFVVPDHTYKNELDSSDDVSADFQQIPQTT